MVRGFTTYACKILDCAGIRPWPKLFQNMRTFCVIDLARAPSPYLATAWMGHSADAAREFYRRAAPAEYARELDRFSPTRRTR